MQTDFHYYCIYVLANLSGFDKNRAKIIAYSSQFVDDSTDSEQVVINNYRFDTVRTAHAGLSSFNWNVHKKIYFPFHFIPPLPVGEGENYSYITLPDSPFAHKILDEALGDNGELRLYRIGIALHTFADTWSHQYFSGRVDKENDVRKITHKIETRWKSCSKWWNILSDLLKKRVGHLQANHQPDLPYEVWKYTDFRKIDRSIKNYELFLVAAKRIFFILAEINKIDAQSVWQQNEEKIKELFQFRGVNKKRDLKERCEKWVQMYSDFFGENNDYRYDHNEWKNFAKHFQKAGDIHGFCNTDWAKFQKAALIQRYLVLRYMM